MTLRERVLALEAEVLTKYASTTHLVVRSVLRDLSVCVDARGFALRLDGGRFDLAAPSGVCTRVKLNFPVFINRSMPKQLANGSFDYFVGSDGHTQIPIATVWADFISLVERWARLPNKTPSGPNVGPEFEEFRCLQDLGWRWPLPLQCETAPGANTCCDQSMLLTSHARCVHVGCRRC
jgi:hypothetical protein